MGSVKLRPNKKYMNVQIFLYHNVVD